MKEYQKVLLLIWPKLDRLAEGYKQFADAKACSSFIGKETSEHCIEKILHYIYMCDCFSVLKERLSEVLSQLNREELYMLEYKYFRRKKVLEGFTDVECDCSERTYYRRQKRLGEKLNSLFLRAGMDESWFMNEFSEMPLMMGLLEKVRADGALSTLDKRLRCDLRVRDAARNVHRRVV